ARSVSPVAESQVSSALLPTTIRHVIIVMEENHDLSWTLSDPAFHFLYIHDAHATQAYALCHPSAPNYIAITSATDHQCGSDAVTYYKAGNLAGDAANHGLSWQGLAESMPTPCDRTDAYPYVAHHNPWVFYRNLKSTCSTFDRSFFTPTGASRLQQQLTNRTLPALTFITPNMLHDAHDGTLAAASAWLGKYVLHPVHTSLIYSATTAVIILFDEAYKKGCNCPEAGGYTAGGVTVSGGPIYLVVKSPVSTGADVITKHVSDFSVVTTVEWLLGLPSLGHHDNSAYPALKGLFT
ncbi:MAG TPA: alkaline phosphatase family protein, partial [Thermoplasmata archaeon]|nr:alkaline phosphatase family protein [Thermoplasmata archaeon]